jgi:hypothetical protein
MKQRTLNTVGWLAETLNQVLSLKIRREESTPPQMEIKVAEDVLPQLRGG